MSSLDALAAFHDSECGPALVGTSSAQQSRLSGRKFPANSAAASEATAQSLPPTISAAVAARSEYGGVRAGSWCGTVVWIAIDPARFLLDWERAVAWGLDPYLDIVRVKELFFLKAWTDTQKLFTDVIDSTELFTSVFELFLVFCERVY